MPSTEYGVSGGGRAHSSATAALRGHLRKAAGPFCFERRARKKRDSKRQVIGSACASGCNKQPTKKGEVMADIDDLRATFEQAVAAINRRDLNEYSALWHEQIVAFPPFSPFPVDGKAAVRQLAEANFANVESGSLMPINPQCRVIGTTGLAWGHAALSLKPKDGPLRTVFIRYTWTFAKTDGQWREVAVHGSLMPSGT